MIHLVFRIQTHVLGQFLRYESLKFTTRTQKSKGDTTTEEDESIAF